MIRKRGDVTTNDLPHQRFFMDARHVRDQQRQDRARSSGQHISTSSITDHYRAVPLSDGHHILYTDPRTGTLSVGVEAPAGSRSRLICKARFVPPTNKSSLPVLYTAGSDPRKGVCVMATFSVIGGDDSLGEDVLASSLDVDPPRTSDTDKQLVVLYTIPHDLQAIISEDRCRQRCMITTQDKKEVNQLDSMYGRPKGSCNNIKFPDHPFVEETEYPLQIRGQPVAICRNLVELAINSGPDMVLWAFSAQGWARAWALRPGYEDAPHRTVVQADGSLRKVDSKGDYIMPEVDQTISELEVTLEPLSSLEMARERNAGSTAEMSPVVEQYYGFSNRMPSKGSKRIISLELADAMNGIARVSVELD